MKRLLSFALPFVVAIALAAWGQSNTTPSPSSTDQATSPTSNSSTQTNTQESTPSQANPATSSPTAQSGTEASNQSSLEGCIVRQQTDYFLQPDSGQPVKLNSSEDLSQHVGHRVRVQGTSSAGTASSAANAAGNAAGNQAGNAASAAGNAAGDAAKAAESQAGANAPEITVTKVEMISESCPSAMPHNDSQNPK